MGSSGVEFFSSGHRDHAEVTFRDTESGDSVVVEGLRTVYLQGAIRNYVRTLGYRDEDKNALGLLQQGLSVTTPLKIGLRATTAVPG